MFDKMREAEQNFIKVRDELNTPETRVAFNLCWKKPWKFYKEHNVNDAIEILKAEAMNI